MRVKRTKNRLDKYKTYNKTVDLNPNISIITFHMHGLNSLILKAEIFLIG